MTRHQFARRTIRPRDHLVAAGRRYPGAWSAIDEMRAGRGRDYPDWPDWCYVPIAGPMAIIATSLGIDVRQLGALHPGRVPDAAVLAALGAWRMTQGIYRFDPAVYDAVRSTPVTGDIPHEVLYRLPEWCVYVETPGLAVGAATGHGAFAHLEADANTGRPELRLLLDIDAPDPQLLPVVLHLEAWSLAESISRMLDTAAMREIAESIVLLLLYLCTQASEISGKGRPGNPQPVRTHRDGWRLFAADGPRTWDVGVRLGAALRRAYTAEQTGQQAPHAGPRPHIRRAHWHTILSGPRLRDGAPVPSAERQADLRWMPPIAVNLDDPGELPATIRPVR